MHSYELPIGLWHLQLLWMQEHHLVGEGRLFHNEGFLKIFEKIGKTLYI